VEVNLPQNHVVLFIDEPLARYLNNIPHSSFTDVKKDIWLVKRPAYCSHEKGYSKDQASLTMTMEKTDQWNKQVTVKCYDHDSETLKYCKFTCNILTENVIRP